MGSKEKDDGIHCLPLGNAVELIDVSCTVLEQRRSRRDEVMLNGDEPATSSLLYLLSTRGTQCNLSSRSLLADHKRWNSFLCFSLKTSHASTIFPPCPLASTHCNSSSSCNLSSPCSPRRTMYNLFTRTCRLLARRGMYNASYLRLSRREDNNATYL